MNCFAFKNKHSEERCSAKALKNLLFCGKHVKSKTPRVWKESMNKTKSAIKIQKIWRGWNLRQLLLLSCSGKFKRECTNEEDVVTYDPIKEIHPLNYFEFTEGGKNYGFDVRSIYQLSLKDLKPINPYTRQELDLETRKRMKEFCYKRERRNLYPFHDESIMKDRDIVFDYVWMTISQMLEENLTIDINPAHFTSLPIQQLWTFIHLLRTDLQQWTLEKSPDSRRHIYYAWITLCWRRQTLEALTAKKSTMMVGGVLLRILRDIKNPYDLCFKILSARHQL